MRYGHLIPKIYPTGVFIQSIKQTESSNESGGDNVFTVTLTNHTQQRFVVKNGHTGSACEGIAEIRASVDNSVGTPTVEVVETDAGAKKNIHFIFKNLKGETGDVALTEEVKQYIDNAIVSAKAYTDTCLKGVQQEIDKNSSSLKTLENGVFIKRGAVESSSLNLVVKTGFYTVSYEGYTGALLVFNVGGSAGIVQFIKDGYGEFHPWRYRNALDSDTKRWTPWRTIATKE